MVKEIKEKDELAKKQQSQPYPHNTSLLSGGGVNFSQNMSSLTADKRD
jgi:hypothetical protein